MTSENTDKELEDDFASDDATDENIILDSSDDDFANTIVDASVDALVAKMDATDAEEAERKRIARKRLEELNEQRSRELDDTFNIDLDDDL
ncbi:MAG: hypothetical protein GWP67_03820 [Gammaproteobacteria bacterium]|jgi:hypothetical protein|nr:hypothetical protein [Gammaproteobacteria bacterium]